MVTDTGVIMVSVISILGMIVFLYLSQYNYFKKKTFLHKLAREKKIDKLKFDKLKKEMGVSDQSKKDLDQNEDLSSLISNIANKYINTDNEDEEEGEGGMIENILGTVVENNPELVQRVLGGISKKRDEDQEEMKYLGE